MYDGKIVVYAAGVFDFLHYGHIRYLQAAKMLAPDGILVVGVLTDEGARAYKHAPLIGFHERWEVVKALHCVDYVVRQEDTDPTESLIAIASHAMVADILTRGDDFHGDPPGTEYMKRVGGKVVKIPYTHAVSSSMLKKAIIDKHNAINQGSYG